MNLAYALIPLAIWLTVYLAALAHIGKQPAGKRADGREVGGGFIDHFRSVYK